MYPQSELDNYKLQVELLQEKLQRSEANRQQLEQNLEQILQKRNEHDKSLRSKTRQKYQLFLDEQQKRNERNKTLVQMLERIDEQTSAMSARSERLKMMKMQYEMYFAKLVQSQTMRCIQNTTAAVGGAAPTPIPILLPTSAGPTMMTSTPIKVNEYGTPTATSGVAALDANILPASATYCLTPRSQNSEGTTTVAPQHWTLAMATPTPTGMLLAHTSTTAAAMAPNNNYMQYPIGYVPHSMQQLQQLQQLQQFQHFLQPRTSAPFESRTRGDDFLLNNIDERPTFEKMSDAFKADPMHLPATHNTNDSFAVGNGLEPIPTSMRAKATTPSMMRIDNEQPQRVVAELPPMSETSSSSSSSLTIDKLPKTKLMTMTEKNFKNTDDVENEDGRKPQVERNFNEFVEKSSGSFHDKGALLNPRMEMEEKSVSSPVADDVNKNANVGGAAAADFRPRQKIDEAWQLPSEQKVTKSWQSPSSIALATPGEDINSELGNAQNTYAEKNKSAEAHNRNSAGGFTEVTGSGGEKESLIPQKHAKTDNQSLPSTLAEATPTPAHPVSLENIENAIYGELVNPLETAVDPTDIRNAAHGLIEDLVTPQQHKQDDEVTVKAVAPTSELAVQPQAMEVPQQKEEIVDYANYGTYGEGAQEESYNPTTTSVSESYDPTYATIEGITNAEVYPQAQATETSYSDEAGAPADPYQQYNDPNAAAADVSQLDYTNADYTNYDQTQYEGAYDPNAYPGYTYDEATGQYTANDPNQPYTADEAYANQGYDQQQYEQGNQQAGETAYDYSNYEQDAANPSEVPAPEFAESTMPAEMTNEEAILDATATAEDATGEPTPNSVPKPASILSTNVDKQVAPNDAQQKKKKRVNFVDSSETDDSSSAKAAAGGTSASAVAGGSSGGAASSESDFDFSSSGGGAEGTATTST